MSSERGEKKLQGNGLPEVLTVYQVAEFMQMPKNRIYQLVADERIPSVRFGRQIRILKSKLMEYLENGNSKN